MRLTLRTLLAYVDDILDASDQEELRKKIEGSEFASDLLHRTRDTMRRLRLGAPPVFGGDGNLDPNTVAEYLDNTLPAEQVSDFERICLESDIHLAEVGSCHQILTMVLGEPAEIDPETRQRIYQVPNGTDGNPKVEAAAPDQEVSPGPAPLPRAEPLSEPPHVPDYLREPFIQRHFGKLVLAAILLVATTIALDYFDVVIIFRTPDTTDPPPEARIADASEPPKIEDEDDLGGAALSGSPLLGEDMLSDDSGIESEAPPFEPGPPMDGPAIAAENPPVKDPLADDLPEIPNGSEDSGPGAIPIQANDIPPAPEPGSITNLTIPSLPPEPNVEISLPAVPGPDPGPVANDRDENILRQPETIPAQPGIVPSGTPVAPTNIEPSLPPVPVPDSDPGPGTDPGNGIPAIDGDPSEPAPRRVLATYVANPDILLRYDNATKEWIRLEPRAKLHAGDLLLAVPAFRPKIALLSGIQVQLDGGTRVVLIDGSTPEPAGVEADLSGLEITYGRVIIDSTLSDPTAISLRIGDEKAHVRFDGASTLAIDVHRDLPPGANPLTGPAIVTANFHATTGQLAWLQGSESLEITPPSSWQLTETGFSAPVPLDSMAGLEWINGVMLSGTDRLAAENLEDALESGQPITLRLSELTNDRRREVKSLVGRTSMHVGQFGPFINNLNDSDQRAVWDEHILTLKTALALSPEVATEVRESFWRIKGEQRGEALFRMLWGYSEEDIRQGVLSELIDKLDDDHLDCRVLAYYNLHHLTGKGFGYRPADRQKNRERAIRTWRERLKSDELL